MKNSLVLGKAKELEITVTPDMEASFEGKKIHPLLSTSSLIHYMEFAARQLLVDYLAPDEEAMGFNIDVSHLMLTVSGMKIKIKAAVSEIRDNKVVCDVEAYNIRGKIARGSFTQAIVKKNWLENKIKELNIITHLADCEAFDK